MDEHFTGQIDRERGSIIYNQVSFTFRQKNKDHSFLENPHDYMCHSFLMFFLYLQDLAEQGEIERMLPESNTHMIPRDELMMKMKKCKVFGVENVITYFIALTQSASL